MVNVNVFTHDQLSDKGPSERRTERTVDPAAEVIDDVFLYLLSNSDHIRKDKITSVKAVVVNAYQVILRFKVIYDV